MATMEPEAEAGTGAGTRPAGYLGQRRLHTTFLGRAGAVLPLALVAASVVTVLLVLAVSAILPSEAAPIPGTGAGSSGSVRGGGGPGGGTAGGPPSAPDSGAAPGPGSSGLTVTNPGVQTGTVGVPVRLQIQVAEAAAGQRLTYSATGLPKGLTLDTRTGLVSGTPAAAGTSTVTVKVRNAANVSTSASFVWTIDRTNGTGIRNGGFETGALAPWACGAGTAAVVPSPVHGGGHALRGTTTNADIAQCTQSIAVTPNTRYTLTAWVSGSYAYAGVSGPGTPDANTWATTPDGGYSRLTVAFTTGATTTSVTIYVHGWYGQGPYYVDDVSLG